MLELNEQNFKESIQEGRTLVFFYREKGCSFCDQMKPVFDALEGDFVKAKYALGQMPDSITQGLIEAFPTFIAYVDGKLVGKQQGAMPESQLALTFTPEKIPQKKQEVTPISKASLQQLMGDKYGLMDTIAELRSHLAKVNKEIERRTKLVEGPLKSCCDGCTDGGDCDGGCH